MTAYKRFNWQVFLVLWLAAIWGVIAVIPYTLQLQSETLARLSLPVPLWILIPIQIAQSAVLLAVATGVGLVTSISRAGWKQQCCRISQATSYCT